MSAKKDSTPLSRANNSTSSEVFESEDELPLSKLVSQVKAGRNASRDIDADTSDAKKDGSKDDSKVDAASLDDDHKNKSDSKQETSADEEVDNGSADIKLKDDKEDVSAVDEPVSSLKETGNKGSENADDVEVSEETNKDGDGGNGEEISPKKDEDAKEGNSDGPEENTEVESPCDPEDTEDKGPKETTPNSKETPKNDNDDDYDVIVIDADAATESGDTTENQPSSNPKQKSSEAVEVDLSEKANDTIKPDANDDATKQDKAQSAAVPRSDPPATQKNEDISEGVTEEKNSPAPEKGNQEVVVIDESTEEDQIEEGVKTSEGESDVKQSTKQPAKTEDAKESSSEQEDKSIPVDLERSQQGQPSDSISSANLDDSNSPPSQEKSETNEENKVSTNSPISEKEQKKEAVMSDDSTKLMDCGGDVGETKAQDASASPETAAAQPVSGDNAMPVKEDANEPKDDSKDTNGDAHIEKEKDSKDTPSLPTLTAPPELNGSGAENASAQDMDTEKIEADSGDVKMNVEVESPVTSEGALKSEQNSGDALAKESPKVAATEAPIAKTDETVDVDNEDKELSKEEPSPVVKRPPLYEWIVEEESEDDDDPSGAFSAFTNKARRRKKRRKAGGAKAKPGIIKLALPSVSDNKKNNSASDDHEPLRHGRPVWAEVGSSVNWSIDEEDGMDKDGMDDSLAFFQEPHEDQDPSFIQWQKEKLEQEFAAKLKELEIEDETGRKQIEQLISAQLKEKQASTDRSVEKYRARTTAERDKDMQRLLQLYKDKMASSNAKINQGIQVLRKRHQQEIQKVRQQHRQQVQHRHIPEQVATAQWGEVSQRLAAKHQRQMQEFTAKGEEVKKRCDTEHKRDQEKLKSQFEKRMRDIEANRQSIYARMYSGFQQLRQRYVKRHLQKIAKKKETMAASRVSSVDHDENQPMLQEKGSKDEKGPSPRDIVKSAMEEKAELRPPSPIKTCLSWVNESPHEKSGAALRHKHRKGVLSQITKQLSVEIHNEGIWVSTILDKKSSDASEGDANKSGNNEGSSSTGNDGKSGDDNKSGQQSGSGNSSEEKEFIPWGVKAREILESIICGEIPHGYGSDRFDFGETTTLYGGHIRCVMTDLRTSEESASAQRAAAVREQEEASLADVEKKTNDFANQATAAEQTLARVEHIAKEASSKVDETVKDKEQAKRNLVSFRTKFSRYLGPDGNPLPATNPTDRQKLLKAAMQYKNSVDTAEKREKAARKALTEAKTNIQKQQMVLKQSQRAAASASIILRKKKAVLAENKATRGGLLRPKISETAETERAAVRVKEAIDALGLVAQKRRDQLNQKRSSSTSSSWVQTLPGLPGPLRKSLWHKMHRRRQQIVLRPSPESQISDLRSVVTQKLTSSQNGRRPQKDNWVEKELIKAEQLFLLAVHPLAPLTDVPSSVPASSSNDLWAEPGWHLVLDAPEHETTLLPCAPSYSVLQRNLSESHSAPGRQAASLIRTTHLRSLAHPLSAVATATSLSETNPGISASPSDKYAENDPLHCSSEAMQLGYKFAVRAQSTKSTTAQRKKSATNKDVSVAAAAAAVRKQVGSTISQSGDQASTSATASSTAASSATGKTEKKRRGSRAEGSRPAQRRKSESKQSNNATSSASSRSTAQQSKANAASRQTAAAARNLSQQASAQLNQQAAPVYNQFTPATQQPQQRTNVAAQQQHQQRANAVAQQQQQTMQQQLLQQQQQKQQQQQQTMQQRRQQQQRQQQQRQQQPPQAYQNPQQQQQQQQMAQLRMMQHQQPPQAQQMAYNQNPQAMQQMQQFFAPMPQQGYPQQPMPMPGHVMGQPGNPMQQMNVQPGNQPRMNPPGAEDQTDPLFILKDMS